MRDVLPSVAAQRSVEPHRLRTLVRGKYFDGLSIVRSQDNFVVQWADPAEKDHKKSLGTAQQKLAPEFDRRAAGLKFVALPDPARCLDQAFARASIGQ